MDKGVFENLGDLVHGASQYPWGLFHPKKAFSKPTHPNQRVLFDCLLQNGFHRTIWQLIFPGQTGGLVMTDPVHSKFEYHIRFYEDGTIDCEWEGHRIKLGHWIHENGLDYLREFITEKLEVEESIKQRILMLLGEKPYWKKCIRRNTVH